MKKILLPFLLFFGIAGSAQVTIDTSRITRGDLIQLLLKYQVVDTVPTPRPDPQPEPTPYPEPEQPVSKEISAYVDAYYTAQGSIYDASGTVTQIKAEKGQNLPYAGLAAPTIRRPYFLGGEIIFTNQPNANFKLLTRANDNPFTFPDEVTIVFRKMPGTEWEAITSGWGNYYIGFSNDNIRVCNANGYLKEKAFPEYFKVSCIHVRYESDGAHVWLNGKYCGKVETTDISRRLGYGVGIETNSTDFNWIASMFVDGGLSDEQRAEYFKAIEDTYNIGSMPNLPYASDIKLFNTGSQLTPQFKYNGAKEMGKVEYQWWKMIKGLEEQQLISTDPIIPYQRGVKCCVKVYDVDGNGWMFVSGKYQ